MLRMKDARMIVLQLLLLLLLYGVSSSWSSSQRHLTSSSSSASTECDERFRGLCDLVNLMSRTGSSQLFNATLCRVIE